MGCRNCVFRLMGFFDNIMVVSEDKSERDNRLGLLMEVRALAGTIADFDKIEG